MGKKPGCSKSLCFLFMYIGLLSCDQVQEGYSDEFVEDTVTLAFYNLENLFDPVDDTANQGDDEFLPEAKKEWTRTRYQTKLNNLGRVIRAMQFPAVLGVAEVENEQVLQDLVSVSDMKEQAYSTVHFQTDEYRGIEVALLYRKNAFRVLEMNSHSVNFPDKPYYRTRDILQVKGILENIDTLQLFIVHFPSRSGGLEETEPLRMLAAERVNRLVQIYADQGMPSLIMGDFNDEPFDKSLMEVLEAGPIVTKDSFGLMNPFWEPAALGEGSYKFRGQWQMLDQIIFNNDLLDDKGYQYIDGSAQVFNRSWLLQQEGRYAGYPSRTYAGDQYLGGFSDHLPVMLQLATTERK